MPARDRLARLCRPVRVSAVLGALLALFAVLGGALAGPASAAPGTRPPSGSTVARERVVLRLIDDICGDTWCEGDHLFDFRYFACDPEPHGCVLRLRIAPLVEPGVRPRWQWRSGHLHGFLLREMVVRAPDGRTSLAPAFYAAVSALVTRLEATVP